jgi:pSer/pThr/pTyr-binding forkhead associated (FHA) protein
MSAVLVLVLRLLMAAALYAFLGLALYMLWQELRQHAEMLTLLRIPTLILNSGQESHTFQKADVLLGRALGNDLRLDDPTVSAYHARLSFHHGHWWVEDLHSTNGTALNGERIQTATVLVDGDSLQIGAVTVHVKILPITR